MKITLGGEVENEIGVCTRKERWMSADNRHYSTPAGVFVWAQKTVTHTHTSIFRRHTNTFSYIGSATNRIC